MKHIYSTGVIYDHHLRSSKYFYNAGHRCFPTRSHETFQVVRNRSKLIYLETFLFGQKDFETSLSKFCCSSDFVTRKTFLTKKNFFFVCSSCHGDMTLNETTFSMTTLGKMTNSMMTFSTPLKICHST